MILLSKEGVPITSLGEGGRASGPETEGGIRRKRTVHSYLVQKRCGICRLGWEKREISITGSKKVYIHRKGFIRSLTLGEEGGPGCFLRQKRSRENQKTKKD